MKCPHIRERFVKRVSMDERTIDEPSTLQCYCADSHYSQPTCPQLLLTATVTATGSRISHGTTRNERLLARKCMKRNETNTGGRATFEPEGRQFESARAHHQLTADLSHTRPRRHTPMIRSAAGPRETASAPADRALIQARRQNNRAAQRYNNEGDGVRHNRLPGLMTPTTQNGLESHCENCPLDFPRSDHRRESSLFCRAVCCQGHPFQLSFRHAHHQHLR